MFVKKFNAVFIILSLVSFQACQMEDDEQPLGYVFVNQVNNQAITAEDGMQGTGSVFFRTKTETRNQVWKKLQVDWNAYQLQNVVTGKCLALSMENASNAPARIELAECENTPSQYWLVSQKYGGGSTISLTGSSAYLGFNPLCHNRVNRSSNDGVDCDSLVVVSASEASNFDMIQVEIDDDPGGDDGTPTDDDPGGDDGAQNDDDPGGDDGTPTDDDPGGDDGTPTDDDPGGDDGTGDPGDQCDRG